MDEEEQFICTSDEDSFRISWLLRTFANIFLERHGIGTLLIERPSVTKQTVIYMQYSLCAVSKSMLR